ncbi:MAG: ATP-binding cassette domain-containing protein [Acidimicrobiia bacterium]|nr:ATP-binding cassette domain-containing protein [Acidimicrobiia bacterium]
MFRSDGKERRRRPVEPFRKPSTAELSQLRRLFRFAKPYRKAFAIGLLGVVVSTAAGLVFPRVMGDLVNNMQEGARDSSALNRTALLLASVFLIQAMFSFVRIYSLALVGEGTVADLRTETYRHLMTLPVGFFDSRKTGEITSRLTSDVAVVQSTVSASLANALAQSVTLIGGTIMLVVTSWRLTATVVLILPLAIVAARIFGRRLRAVSTAFQDRLADAIADAEETISAVRVIKWFSAEDTEVRRYSGKVQAAYQVALRRARMRGLLNPIVTFVAFGTLALVLWQGGHRVIAGQMQLGSLVAFLLYTIMVAGAIAALSAMFAELMEALGASRRIFDLLDAESEVKEAENPVPLVNVEGRVVYDNVGFRYGDRAVQVLASVDLEVKPGEVVALVGPSGAGKSTLVQLIPRFFDVIEGRVLVDGVDIRDVRLADLRACMAAVPQETQLFSGSIAENLRVGKPGATDAELVTAAEAANAHDFITAFPDAYETVVGERGIKLSGGQRQRVAIARAILKDPRILILDEATSSLDTESEAVVQEALDVLMQGRTTLVIAHRLSTVRNADRILALDGGRIVEEGTHDELIEKGGLYADLYSRQLIDTATADAPSEAPTPSDLDRRF